MIYLTPDEAAEYEKGGLMAAIRAFRHRTNLGLVDSKRAVESWLGAGKPTAPSGKKSTEDELLEKLSEALTRARNAEDALHQMKLKAQMIAAEVAGMAKDLPDDMQETWYRACGRMSEEFSKRLGKV